jgi:hypothetical protein
MTDVFDEHEYGERRKLLNIDQIILDVKGQQIRIEGRIAGIWPIERSIVSSSAS